MHWEVALRSIPESPLLKCFNACITFAGGLLCVVQGKEVIEYYINELLTEGIYHVPTWAELSESGASVSAVDETGSSPACAAAAAAANASSLSVVASLSGQALLRAASSASTMQLGASAGNIAIDNEGTGMIHMSVSFICHIYDYW